MGVRSYHIYSSIAPRLRRIALGKLEGGMGERDSTTSTRGAGMDIICLFRWRLSLFSLVFRRILRVIDRSSSSVECWFSSSNVGSRARAAASSCGVTYNRWWYFVRVFFFYLFAGKVRKCALDLVRPRYRQGRFVVFYRGEVAGGGDVQFTRAYLP